MPLTTVALLL